MKGNCWDASYESLPMPLKCVTSEGETLLAFNFDSTAWQELAQSNRRQRQLVMPCCGRHVVLKTSQCGTRFFAHWPREGSTCPRESEEHLQAKDLIARAVVQAGWTASTEAPLSPLKQVVDVLATKGVRRVAFEVQWSRQKREDTLSRHLAYEEAGVRALWLFKQSDYPCCKEIPAFRLVRTEDRRSYNVWVWHEGHSYLSTTEPSQVVELQEFVRGALSGRLKWAPALGLTVPAIAHVATGKCRRAHETQVLTGIDLDIGKMLPGHLNLCLPVEAFSEYPEFLRTQQARALLAENGLALQFGVANRSLPREPENFRRYVMACCSKCDSTFYYGDLRDAKPKRLSNSEITLELSSKVMEMIPSLKEAFRQWWFEPRLTTNSD